MPAQDPEGDARVDFPAHAAGSDAAARIAETPYSICVTIVLTEIERMGDELVADLKSGRGVAVSALLKDVHDAVRGVREKWRTDVLASHGSTYVKRSSGPRARGSASRRSMYSSQPGESSPK